MGTQCKEGAQREGLMLDSADELYKWFTNQVMKNLHVVFTMNPSEDGLKDKAATSPAPFNRCVLNWFGDWGLSALFQVGREFTLKMDLERPAWKQPDFLHFKVSEGFTVLIGVHFKSTHRARLKGIVMCILSLRFYLFRDVTFHLKSECQDD